MVQEKIFSSIRKGCLEMEFAKLHTMTRTQTFVFTASDMARPYSSWAMEAINLKKEHAFQEVPKLKEENYLLRDVSK